MTNIANAPDTSGNIHRSLPEPIGRDVVLFDGQCQFCRSQIAILRRLDWFSRLEMVSLHDPRVGQQFPDLTIDQLMEQMWVITPIGDRYGGADAVRYMTRHLPSLYLLAPLMHIPGSMPLWRRLYGWIAKHRYRLTGKHCEDNACQVHTRR
jgi:predicted DCC family thiol-disulfide oxidoreductase YuxK